MTNQDSSDPVRQVLTNMIYYVMRNSHYLEQIRGELAGIDIHNYKILQHLPHLNAAIYETLRLNPAVPSTSLRLPPKEGMTIYGVYIPEHTTIVTPQYSLMRGILQLVLGAEIVANITRCRPSILCAPRRMDSRAISPHSPTSLLTRMPLFRAIGEIGSIPALPCQCI